LRLAPCGIKFGPVGKLMDSITVRKEWDAGIEGFFAGLKHYADTGNGYVFVGPGGSRTEKAIKKWVDQGAAFVATLDGDPAETRSLDK